jgi:hypothetical protein
VRAAAAGEGGREREQQIEIESAAASNHSVSHQIGIPTECKEL